MAQQHSTREILADLESVAPALSEVIHQSQEVQVAQGLKIETQTGQLESLRSQADELQHLVSSVQAETSRNQDSGSPDLPKQDAALFLPKSQRREPLAASNRERHSATAQGMKPDSHRHTPSSSESRFEVKASQVMQDTVEEEADDISEEKSERSEDQAEEQEPDQSCRSISESELNASIQKSCQSLQEITEDWKTRVDAMAELSRLVSQHSACEWSGWYHVMDQHLVTGLAVQVADPRSIVVRQTCDLIVAIAEHSGDSFSQFFPRILPTLFKSLYVTIKVIRESCDACIRNVLPHCAASGPVLAKILSASNDPHKELRRRCLEYVGILLSLNGSRTSVDHHIQEVASLILTASQDKDEKVRASARKLFVRFKGRFPDGGKALYDRFPSSVRISLQREAKVSVPGQRPARARRASLRSLRRAHRDNKAHKQQNDDVLVL